MRRGIALIGTGRTGNFVKEAIPGDLLVGSFSRSNPVSVETLRGCAAAIVFVPADGMPALLPLLLESKVPVACGTTGFKWEGAFDEQLRSRGIPWIVASNFSVGMNFMFSMAKVMGPRFKELGLLPDYKMREVHHVHKKDSPSGTALTWQSALGEAFPIDALREGDERGLHELTVSLPGEQLHFRHQALDRSCFAKGAVMAAQDFLPKLKPGLHRFEDLYFRKFMEAQ